MERATRHPRALIVGVKLGAGAVVLALGFRAVSDDDFARVVIAQQLAEAPRLDPSGTSWLPLPFWITGGAMALFGRDLLVARAVAVVLGVVAALGMYAAARWLFRDPSRALCGALIAAVLPWSARLGVAMVPELPVAAAIVIAAASTAPGWTPRRRMIGGAVLAAACLARYEPWLVAVPFALLTAIDARLVRSKNRVRLGVAAIMPVAAPAAWIAWNAHAHGSAFAFLERVASYRKALGEGPRGLGGAALEYGRALLVAEPELVAVFAVLAIVALVSGGSAAGGASADLRIALRRPALLLGCVMVLLVVAGMKDGAPTHHPERALLAPLLFVALVVGALVIDLQRTGGTRWRRGAVFGALIVAVLAAGSVRRRHAVTLLARTDEVAIGELAGREVPRGEKVLVEAVDYGSFAIRAGSGRPEDLVVDRDLDPRREVLPSSFGSAETLAARVEATGARWAIGRAPVGGVPCAAGRMRGGWCLVALDR